MRIGVLGAGSWGTALASTLASFGRARVVLWGRDGAAIDAMRTTRTHPGYLPGITLDAALEVTADFEAAADADLVVIATPVAGLRETVQRLLPRRPPGLLWLCKGFEADTRALPHEVVAANWGTSRHGVLSGPSFADEVARGLPCAVVLASHDASFAHETLPWLHGGALRVYTSDDVVGVEVAGAVKNVMAIATGIADGLALGANARAALITRGLAEIARLGAALGARAETFMGLAGVGDLLLTCTGDLSRNRRVGLALGRGASLTDTLDGLGHVAEGVRSAPSVRALAREHGIDMPITDAVCRVLFEGWSAPQALTALLAREARRE